MKTKIELVHEYLLRFSGTTVADAWNYVDAMQVEADKREHKDQVIPDGFVVVSQKDLLELTIAINAVDLATHTESKTNEVREMWQQVALKLMALNISQEQNSESN